jgi:hypothetical protein
VGKSVEDLIMDLFKDRECITLYYVLRRYKLKRNTVIKALSRLKAKNRIWRSWVHVYRKNAKHRMRRIYCLNV